MSQESIQSGQTAIIACDVLRDEVVALSKDALRLATTLFLRQGLHNDPPLLRKEVQVAIDQIEQDFPQVQEIVLVYGLCSRGIEGVCTSRCRLIIPRAHDCITLLLGDRRVYQAQADKHPGTYWYSPGWNRCHVPPGPARYESLAEEYRKKFSADDVQYLLEMELSWMKNYSRAAYVELPGSTSEQAAAFTQECATWLGWTFDHFTGDVSLLRDLLSGSWDDERFLVLLPGHSPVLSADDRVITSEQVGIHRRREPR